MFNSATGCGGWRADKVRRSLRGDSLVGETVAHYRLVREIGSGGMGVVYEAEDTRLRRRVALKFVPQDDGQSRDQLLYEARTASALNHPNICTVYAVEEHEGRSLIAMELLEGNSLNAVLARGPMQRDGVIEICMQVADALQCAHERGIVHRDIKPANIFVCDSGRTKLLDFGIARPVTASLRAAATTIGSGAVLEATRTAGTIAYMSPEQARGDDLDARSDLFSLGAVMFEMLTGHLPFEANTSAVMFHALLDAKPAPAINTVSDGGLATVVSKLLEKDRALRYASAAELRSDLKRLAQAQEIDVRPKAPRENSSRNRKGVAAGALAIVVLSLGVVSGMVWRNRARSTPFTDFTISRLTNSGNVRLVAASPDGKYLLTVNSEKGQESLWLRNLPTNSIAQVMPPDPRRYANLSFSPDGNYIFFERERELYRAPVLGGAPQRLLHPVDSNITFSADAARIAFTRDQAGVSELVVANADGSGEKTIATSHEIMWRSAAWSPKEDVIVAAAFRPDSSLEELVSVDVGSGKQEVLQSSDQLTFTNAVWMPDGRSLIVSYGDKATGFHRLQVGSVEFPSGKFRAITRDVNSYDSVSVSGDGKSIAAVVKQGGYDAYAMNANGTGAALPLSSHQDLNFISWETEKTLLTDDGARLFRVTTDTEGATSVIYEDRQHPFVTGAVNCGTSAIAFTAVGAGKDSNVWLMQKADSSVRQLTRGVNDFAQFCSPDGQWVYYLDETTHALIRVSAQTGKAERLAGPKQNSIAGLSADGSMIARFVTASGRPELLIENASTGQLIKMLMPDARVADATHGPRFLSDGRAIAYIVGERGVDNIMVQPLDGGAPQRLTSFTSDRIRDFGFSPAGAQIAIVRGHFDSDAVLLQEAKR